MAKLQSHIKHPNPSLKMTDLATRIISKAILNLSSSSSSNSSMIKGIIIRVMIKDMIKISSMITANRIINMTITKIPLNKTITITIKPTIKATTTRATIIMTINSSSKLINQSTVSKPTPKNKKMRIGTMPPVVLPKKPHPQPSNRSMLTCRLRIVLTKIIYSRCATANNRQQQLNLLCLTHTPPKINLSLINSHTSSHNSHTNSRGSNPRPTNNRSNNPRQTIS